MDSLEAFRRNRFVFRMSVVFCDIDLEFEMKDSGQTWTRVLQKTRNFISLVFSTEETGKYLASGIRLYLK